jgi:hypothetical protein
MNKINTAVRKMRSGPLELEQCIDQDLEHHPDAAIYHSMPRTLRSSGAGARRVGDDLA